MVTSVQISSRALKQKGHAGQIPVVAPQEDLSEALLHLSQLLQTSLDTKQVLKLFFQQLQHEVKVGGILYTHESKQLAIKHGKQNAHHCNYRLSNKREKLGEISFNRNQRFSEQELITIETLMGALILPLKNSLLYGDALAAAMCDSLTQTGNRGAMENNLQREVRLAHRYKQPLSMMVIDIDHFKAVNDNFGHMVGDLIIQQVAQAIITVCRETDLTFRYGGEEFVVLLNKTDASGARIIAERVRRYIEKQELRCDKQMVGVTVSIGSAELSSQEDGQELFKRTDDALYQAKESGRNRVVSLDIDDNSQQSLLEA